MARGWMTATAAVLLLLTAACTDPSPDPSPDATTASERPGTPIALVDGSNILEQVPWSGTLILIADTCFGIDVDDEEQMTALLATAAEVVEVDGAPALTFPDGTTVAVGDHLTGVGGRFRGDQLDNAMPPDTPSECRIGAGIQVADIAVG